MKKWNFKVDSNPKEIIKKLDAALVSDKGFVFKVDNDKDDSILFKIRKRIVFAHQVFQQNRIVVKGKIVKVDAENETDVDISFKHHFLITYGIIEVSIVFLLGLMALTTGIRLGVFAYILVGALFAIGIAIWLAFQKKFKKDVQQYKQLISDILGV